MTLIVLECPCFTGINSEKESFTVMFKLVLFCFDLELDDNRAWLKDLCWWPGTAAQRLQAEIFNLSGEFASFANIPALGPSISDCLLNETSRLYLFHYYQD